MITFHMAPNVTIKLEGIFERNSERVLQTINQFAGMKFDARCRAQITAALRFLHKELKQREEYMRYELTYEPIDVLDNLEVREWDTLLRLAA